MKKDPEKRPNQKKTTERAEDRTLDGIVIETKVAMARGKKKG